MNWPPFLRFSDIDALFRVIQIAIEKSKEWRLRECGSMADARFLSADYVGDAFPAIDLGFVLCRYEHTPHKIQLTMHANRWPHDRSFPSEDEYLAAERLTAPILRDAGKLLGRHLRLSRPVQKSRLVGKLAAKLDGFCASATDHWTGGKLRLLNQTEYERFYEFVVAAHRAGSALEPEEVYKKLLDAGFQMDLTKVLAEHYEIGRRILAMGTWQHPRNDADVWNPWNVRVDLKKCRARRKQQAAEEYRIACQNYDKR